MSSSKTNAFEIHANRDVGNPKETLIGRISVNGRVVGRIEDEPLRSIGSSDIMQRKEHHECKKCQMKAFHDALGSRFECGTQGPEIRDRAADANELKEVYERI